jgi:phosphate transport system protein
MVEGHIYKLFDEELAELKDRILFEGSLVQSAVRNAIASLLNRDSDLARRVIEDDDLINTKEVEVDEFCLKLLALRQPAAKDLRLITTAIKINYDLERMGDIAVNICERVLELNQEPQLKPYVKLPEIAEIAQGMVRDSLEAFVKEDITLAWKVAKDDESADRLTEQIFSELLTYMTEHLKTISTITRLVFISKSLERLADHAVNVAELVIFLVEGRIVRHLKY